MTAVPGAHIKSNFTSILDPKSEASLVEEPGRALRRGKRVCCRSNNSSPFFFNSATTCSCELEVPLLYIYKHIPSHA